VLEALRKADKSSGIDLLGNSIPKHEQVAVVLAAYKHTTSKRIAQASLLNSS
jgi:hypothetical protein